MTLGGILRDLAPEMIVLVGACLALLVGVFRSGRLARAVSPLAFLTLAAALLVSILGPITPSSEASLGLWITSLTGYARWITLSVGILVVLVNWAQSAQADRGEYMALILFSLLGIMLTASANDLVLLFLAVELVSVPTYVLVALSRNESRAAEAAVKYFFLGALATALLAYGLSFLYGAAGTTTIFAITAAGASSNLSLSARPGAMALIGLLLVFGGLAFKIAAFPFHAYAADVYEGAASTVTGMLGFAPKFAGFLALIKIFAAFNWELPATLLWMVWIVAAATMTAGNVLALLQKNAKRMLAYSSIAHTGYMLIGLLVGPVAGQGPMNDGVAALLFYIAVYSAMNLGAFAVLGAFQSGDREMETLDDIGGLSRRAPLAALALAICVFSLIGVPPTGGFLGKLCIFSSAFSLGGFHPFQRPLAILAVLGVINSAIGAAYYLRIIGAAYMGEETSPVHRVGGFPIRVGAAVCSLGMIAVFAWPMGLFAQSRAATMVLHRSHRLIINRVTSDVSRDQRIRTGAPTLASDDLAPTSP